MSKNIILFIFILSILFALFLIPSSSFAAGINANPIISTNVPAFTSDDCASSSPASRANDTDYSTLWRSCNAKPTVSTPVTLSYDLSSVSANSRKQVIVAWYNDTVTGAYDHTLNSTNAYNTPKDYTIQANAGAGGGTPPASGWVTLVTVTGNHYHSRQHSVDLTGYNWVRLSATASDGTDTSNQDISVNMDVHDVSSGVTDDWMFYGDSITMDGLLHTSTKGNTFSQQINANNSSYFPIYEDGGIGGFTSTQAASNITTWLPLFPGKFVTLNYGTNDAIGLVSGPTYYSNMKTMVQAVIAAGKIPIVPKIPWGCTANITADVGTLNAEIDQLYIDFPQIIKGPDLYAYFNAHQSEISGNDCIHPSNYTNYLIQWVNAMQTAVYTLPVVSASPTAGTFSSSQTVTLSSTKPGTIYYTLDGSPPTTSSTTYSAPLTISSTKTVKAIAVDQAGNISAVSANAYTISTPSQTQQSLSGSASTSSSSYSTPNPNMHEGWKKEIMAGPHFIGMNQFIYGSDNARAFISNDATADDAYTEISKTPLTDLVNQSPRIPFPWMQGINTAGEIYKFSAISAFNGYPILTFSKPVTIILPYDQTRLFKFPAQKLQISYFDTHTQSWKLLQRPVVVNEFTHTVATTTTQFSYFTVAYPRPGGNLSGKVLTKNTKVKTNIQSNSLKKTLSDAVGKSVTSTK